MTAFWNNIVRFTDKASNPRTHKGRRRPKRGRRFLYPLLLVGFDFPGQAVNGI